MKNPQVASVFQEIADLLELSGDNPFRIRAYRRAAMNVEAIPKDVAAMSEEELHSLPGIGEDLAHKIRQFVETGRIDVHEELQKKIPHGLLEILRVPGIGPKTARLLFDKRNVKSLEGGSRRWPAKGSSPACRGSRRRPRRTSGRESGSSGRGWSGSLSARRSRSPGGSWNFFRRPFPGPGSPSPGASGAGRRR